MLAMAVVNHQSGGGSTGSGVEEEDDILTRLRKLHQTLQECHWRVGLMDQRVEALQPNLHHRKSEHLKTLRQKQLDKNPIKTDTKQETCKLVNGIYDNEELGDLIDTDDEELSIPVSGRMDNKIRSIKPRSNLVLPVEQINVFETVNGREDILHLAEKHAKDLYDMFQSKASPVENERQCIAMILSEMNEMALDENEMALDENEESENVLPIIKEEEEENTDYLWENKGPLVEVCSIEDINTEAIKAPVATVRNQVSVDDTILKTNDKREDEVNKSSEDLNETYKEIQCNNSEGYEETQVDTERVNGNDKHVMSIIEKVTTGKEMPPEKLISDCDQYINQFYNDQYITQFYSTENMNNLLEKERYDKTLLTLEEQSTLYKLRADNKHWLLNDLTREKRPPLMRSENIDLEEYFLGDITNCYDEGINKQCESFCISKSENVKELDERVDGNDRSSKSVTREVSQKTFPEYGEKYPYYEELSSSDYEDLVEIHEALPGIFDKKDCKSKENSKLEDLQDITNTKLSNDSHRKLKPIKFKTKKRKNIVHKLGLNGGAKQIIIVKDKDALIDNGVNRGRWSLAGMFTLFLLLLMLLLLCYLLLTVPIVTISVKHNGGAVAF